MGGAVFLAEPYKLVTPRMPNAVYKATAARCHAQLRGLFKTVVIPIEGPEKQDHGDIDILVAEPLRPEWESEPAPHAKSTNAPDRKPDIWTEIRAALGAEHFIPRPHENSSHLAIPYDRGVTASRPAYTPSAVDVLRGTSKDPEQPTELTEPPLGSDPRWFIQVDVRICDSDKVVRWGAFKHAHGDLWNILGSIIRPWGLTADETALWLRVPEIEDVDKKRARIFLTDDPDEVLDFLGLSSEEWATPFASYQDLFRYAASTWLFYLDPPPTNPSLGSGDDGDPDNNVKGDKDDKDGDKVAHDSKTNANHAGGGYRYEGTLESLKANDRRRMKTRPLFRAWIEDFIPKSRAAGLYPPSPPFDSTTTTITTVPQSEPRKLFERIVFARFPGSKATYASRRLAFLREQDATRLRGTIIKVAVDKEECSRMGAERFAHCAGSAHEFYAVVISALRKIIFEGDGSFGGIVPEEPLRTTSDDDGDGDGDCPEEEKGGGRWRLDAAREFVERRWRDVAPHAWKKHHLAQAGKMRPKTLKRIAEELAEADDAKKAAAGTSSIEEKKKEQGEDAHGS